MDGTKARLFCKVGELAGYSFAIEDEILIGRHPECSASLNPVQMSNQHARIFFDTALGRFCLEDLESLNGTELDGEAVHGVEPLGHLHVITFAHRFDFIFQDLERCAHRHATSPKPRRPTVPGAVELPPEAERTRIEELPLAVPGILEKLAKVVDIDQDISKFETLDAKGEKTTFQKVIPRLPGNLLDVQPPPEEPPAIASDRRSTFEPTAERPPGLWLRVFLGDDEEQAFPLDDGEHLVGRDAKATIRPSSQEISRRHARLVVRQGTVHVEDLGSRNHTFLNDQEIEGLVEVPIDAELRFGRVVARVIHTGRPSDAVDEST